MIWALSGRFAKSCPNYANFCRFILDVAIAERCADGCAHVLDRCIVDCKADSKCVSDCMRTFDACENGIIILSTELTLKFNG